MLLRQAFRADVTWSPLDPRWYGSVLGAQSDAGITVTADTSLKVSTIYRAINVLANAMAMIPLVVYKRLKPEGKERAPDHYAYAMLHDQPNDWQTSFRWRHQFMGYLLLRGNAYSQIIPGPGSQVVRQLVPLNPDRVRVEQLDNGRLLYRYMPKMGPERIITQDFMLHLRGFTTDGICGVSVIDLMRNAVGLAMGAEKHASKYFKQGTTLSGFLSHPGSFRKPETRERIEDSWRRAYAGADNAWRVPVLEEGMKWESLGMTNKDGQFVESRDFQVGEFLRFIGVPGVLVGYADKTATYASAEQFFLSFVQHGVAPWAVNLAQEMTSALLVDPEQFFVEFILEGLLRGDIATRYNAHKVAIETGWKTRNEARVQEGMNPEPGLDEFLQPLNMGTVGQEPAGATQAPAGGNQGQPAQQAQNQAIAMAVARHLVRTEIGAIHGTRGQKGAAVRFADDPEGWAAWVSRFYGKHARFVTEVLAVSSEAALSYCDAQRDALLAGGVAVIETWEEECPPRLVALALGEAS